MANTIKPISTSILTTPKRPITETASNIEEESSSIRGLLTMESIMIGALFVVLVAVLAIGGFLLYRRSRSGALYIRPSLSANKRDPTIRKRYSARDIHSDLKTGQLFSPQGVSSELYQYHEAEGSYSFPKPKSTTLGNVPPDHHLRLVPGRSVSNGLDPRRPQSNATGDRRKEAKRLRDKFIKNNAEHGVPTILLEPNKLGLNGIGDKRKGTKRLRDKFTTLRNSNKHDVPSDLLEPNKLGPTSVGTFEQRSNQIKAAASQEHSAALGNRRVGNRSTQNTVTHERPSGSLGTNRSADRVIQNMATPSRERHSESLGTNRFGERFSKNDHRATRERLTESLGITSSGGRFSQNGATCEWQFSRNSHSHDRDAYQSPSGRPGTSRVGDTRRASPPLTIIEDNHHYAVPTYKNRSSDNSSTASPVSSQSDNYDEVETPVVLISKPAPGQLVSIVGHSTQDSERLIVERAPRHAQGTRSQDHSIERRAEDDTPVVWISKPTPGQLVSGVAQTSQEHSIGRKGTPNIWYTDQHSNGNQGDDTTSRDSYSTMSSNSSDNPFFRDNNGTISLKLSSKQKSRTQEEFQYLLQEILDDEDYYKVPPRPGTRSEVHYISGTDNGKSEA